MFEPTTLAKLGIPTVVGVKDATRLIQNRQQISMNATTGEINLLRDGLISTKESAVEQT